MSNLKDKVKTLLDKVKGEEPVDDYINTLIDAKEKGDITNLRFVACPSKGVIASFNSAGCSFQQKLSS